MEYTKTWNGPLSSFQSICSILSCSMLELELLCRESCSFSSNSNGVSMICNLWEGGMYGLTVWPQARGSGCGTLIWRRASLSTTCTRLLTRAYISNVVQDAERNLSWITYTLNPTEERCLCGTNMPLIWALVYGKEQFRGTLVKQVGEAGARSHQSTLNMLSFTMLNRCRSCQVDFQDHANVKSFVFLYSIKERQEGLLLEWLYCRRWWFHVWVLHEWSRVQSSCEAHQCSLPLSYSQCLLHQTKSASHHPMIPLHHCLAHPSICT